MRTARAAYGADCRASSNGRSSELRRGRARASSPVQSRRSRAAAASRRAPNDAAVRRRRRSVRGSPRRPRCPKRALPGRRSPRRGRDLKRVLRDASLERGCEGVHVVAALSAVGAFPEEILVDVGDGERVGIHPASTRVDALEERSLATRRQRRRDARLKHRVALDHAAAAAIEPWTVERMGHLPDEPPRSPARESGVAVERDHVADAGGHDGRPSARSCVGRVGRAAEQSIQLVELAAFAFPADPLALAVVPHPPAMQKKKSIAGRRRPMTSIHTSNRRSRHGEKLVVSCRALRWQSPSNPREARSEDRRPDSPDTELQAARSDPRSPPASSREWARRPRTQARRHSARSSRPGNALGPNRFVTNDSRA